MATKAMSHSSLEGMMGRMLDTGLFSDIVLLVGVEKHRFNVHKMVLGGRSEVFSALLQKRWINGDQSQEKEILNFPAHSFAAFKIFLRFLYTDMLTPPETVDEAFEILELSHMYEIAGLLIKVKDLLKQWINAETCLKIYTRSRVIDQDLSEQSFKFFVKNIRSAAEKDKYLEWDAETVKTVLSQEHLDIREVDLFKALLKWANYPYDLTDDITVPRSKAMPELMKMIRFPAMGMQIFANEVVPTGVLSNEEVIQMFLHFANPKQTLTQYNTTLRSVNLTREKPCTFSVYHGFEYLCNQRVELPEVAELRPEIKLEVSKSIRLHGIQIFDFEMEGLFSLEFKFTIKNKRGIVLANKKATKLVSQQVFIIKLDEPLVLRPGKAYDLNVTYKLDTRRQLLSGGNVYCRGTTQHNPAAVNSKASINLVDGVIATITYNLENGSRQTISPFQLSIQTFHKRTVRWIHHVNYSVDDTQESVSPCYIT